MKQSKYRSPSLRQRVYTCKTVDDLRKLAAIVNEAVKAGEVEMTPETVRKLNKAIRERKSALARATLVDASGRPLI